MKYILARLIVTLTLCLGVLCAAAPAYAGKDAVYTPWHNNFAVGGYDAVSFFSGRPTEGDTAYSFDYNGAMWIFSTQENREAFIADPEQYAPAYGGYCAWAVANNKLAKGSPENWTLYEGTLYLNFNDRIQNRWDANKLDFIEKAKSYWPDILN